MGSVTCSERRAEAANEGQGAAWWEDWDVEDAPTRKRKHPTSKPTAEDAQEDQRLAALSIQVMHFSPFFILEQESCDSSCWQYGCLPC